MNKYTKKQKEAKCHFTYEQEFMNGKKTPLKPIEVIRRLACRIKDINDSYENLIFDVYDSLAEILIYPNNHEKIISDIKKILDSDLAYVRGFEHNKVDEIDTLTDNDLLVSIKKFQKTKKYKKMYR